MLPFLIGALRAIVEMLGLALLAQGVLYLIAGPGRQQNPVYRLFELLTRGPRRLLRMAVGPRPGEGLLGLWCFIILFFVWLGLALLRKSL